MGKKPGPGLTVADIADNSDLKDAYLELIRLGHKPNEAAAQCGATGSQFRKLRSQGSQWYDPDFAESYEEAITSSEHRRHLLERIDDALATAAFEKGNTAILQKLALVYHPDWEPLRHQNFRHEVDVLIRRLPELGLSREQIERAIAAEEARLGTPTELRALPAPADVESA